MGKTLIIQLEKFNYGLYLIIEVSMCVHTCGSHAHTPMWMLLYMCHGMHVEVREQHWVSVLAFHSGWDNESVLVFHCVYQVSRPASLQLFKSLSPLSNSQQESRLKYCIRLLTEVWEVKLRSLHLHNPCIYPWAITLAQLWSLKTITIVLFQCKFLAFGTGTTIIWDVNTQKSGWSHLWIHYISWIILKLLQN